MSLYLVLVFALAQYKQWVGWLSFAASVALILSVYKLSNRPVRALAKQRIRYLRGAQAEGLVGWLLEAPPNDWHVFHGMKLVADWDIDHVVVGPGGLYCVSTKGFRGLIASGADGRLTYNGTPTDLLRQTTAQAMQLRDRLQAMLGSDVPYVHAVLAIPLAFIDCPMREGAVLVVHQDDLLNAIEENTKAKPSGSQVERCAKVLDMLEQSAAHLFRKIENPGQPLRIAVQPAGKVT